MQLSVEKNKEWWDSQDTFPSLGRPVRVLVAKPNDGGCAYYRANLPWKKISEKYPKLVEIRVNQNPLGIDIKTGKWIPNWDFEDMKWADIVFANNISNFGGNYTARICGKAKEFGKIFWFDTDDLLTKLYSGHRLEKVYEEGLSDITKFIYAHSDIVTVTQRKFAERISPFMHNGVLAVVKNTVDYDLQCWRVPKVPPPKKGYVRFGWAGGIHHEEDVKVFAGVPALVNQKVGYQNCRWDFYGKPPDVMPSAPFNIKYPEVKKGEHIHKHPDFIAQIKAKEDEFKDNPIASENLGNWLRSFLEWESNKWQNDVWDNYQKTLMKGDKGPRNWNIYQALGTEQYGVFYSNMDVALAPLQMNDFNDSKSEIKIAEAGRYKVPLIASNVGCYDEWIKDGVTGYLIDPDAHKMEWVKILSSLVKNPNKIIKMGEALHEITEREFNINNQAHRRLNVLLAYYEWKNQPIEIKQ